MFIPEEISAERRRQIEVEGWTPEHDDEHENGEMLHAGVLYYHHAIDPTLISFNRDGAPVGWPWSPKWWKPKDRRRDLIRAGALCVAEIERLRRLSTDRYVGHAQHKLDLIIKALTAHPAPVEP